MEVPLDDFDVILGNNFLILVKGDVMPHLGGVLFVDEQCPALYKVFIQMRRIKNVY